MNACACLTLTTKHARRQCRANRRPWEQTFADWLFAVGKDRLEKIDEDRIRCPEIMVILTQTLNGLINAFYNGIVDAEMDS